LSRIQNMATANSSGVANQNLRSLAGKPVSHAIQELVRLFPEVFQITFAAYRPAPGLDIRLDRNTDPTIEIRQTAERLRQEFGIPFWDAILSISMKSGEIPDRYVELAILHDKSPDEYCIDVLHSEVSVEKVDSLVRGLKAGFVLALSSKVQLKTGGFAHIPMMDFRCAPSPKNKAVVKRALKAMGEDAGLLIDSGRSYHFYGVRLLSQDLWIRFLALGILFNPIVDARYIAHRLADGACRLRVGTGPDKPSMPTIAEIFG
jgi:hypothetical protein